MLTKISSELDAIADRLEKKGFVREALEVDKVADACDRLKEDAQEDIRNMNGTGIKAHIEKVVNAGTSLRKATAKTVKLLNAFSINMLPKVLEGGKESHTVTFQPIAISDAKSLSEGGVESFIGHEDTAAILSDLLGTTVPMNRAPTVLNIGETALVAQFGSRLPEGTKTLPEGAKLTFFVVKVN